MPYRFILSSGKTVTCDTAQEAHDLLALDEDNPLELIGVPRAKRRSGFPLVELLRDLRDSPNEGIHVDQVCRSLGVSGPNGIGSKIRGDMAILNEQKIEFEKVRVVKKVGGVSHWFPGDMILEAIDLLDGNSLI